MAGETLREFDIDLCDCIVGQVRLYLGELPARPKPGAGDRPHGHRTPVSPRTTLMFAVLSSKPVMPHTGVMAVFAEVMCGSNTGGRASVDRFAGLVLGDDRVAAIREAAPPRQK